MSASADAVAAADRQARERLCEARPQWTRVASAAEALGLHGRVLLHAGPALQDPRTPPAPILSSAVMACLHEGWASDEAQAEALIEAGEVSLQPARARGALAPLAAVLSPRTTLVEVRDAGSDATSYSLLASGAGPQIRFGVRSPGLLARLAWRDGPLAQALSAVMDSPLDLLAPARDGLAGGDDLHASTARATASLAATLSRRRAPAEVLELLARSPLFFLTLWMAACDVMLEGARRVRGNSIVARLGGNGERVALELAGLPGESFSAPATPPEGPRLDPALDVATAPMTGDSGVIDACGFGGQRLAGPADALCAGLHPALGVPVGLSAAQAVARGSPPAVALGMIGADGRAGLLGRGLWRAPLAPFVAALDRLRQPCRSARPGQAAPR